MSNNQTFYKELGCRVREAREKNHLTQEALAIKVSLTRTSITNIEKGRQQLLVHTLLEISRALNVTLESLLPEPQFLTEELDDILKTESLQTQKWIRAVVDTARKE